MLVCGGGLKYVVSRRENRRESPEHSVPGGSVSTLIVDLVERKSRGWPSDQSLLGPFPGSSGGLSFVSSV